MIGQAGNAYEYWLCCTRDYFHEWCNRYDDELEEQ